ncbi:alpha-ketoglutarate-dependent dioxygenase AlkB [Mesorhizobium sp. NBSH29]|uniref:alpha-ketoglutarate-dependent dioxygenase AlkB n=1 Tax=Mesorhizobium sp. NBSH29 TaxID=2654249 RepID=UPI0018969ECE|nr:alpha-ketoglutarate-dependent dioxygenase AlkB [Mesorhizobium sp. NBSH29]QPC86094.1 alpha-ketoglutarate-dependent dioxygenase AlkB [Mesorhizobium sp. NBSH29]
MLVLPKGVRHIPGYLTRDAQVALVADVRAVVEAAPFYRPEMPSTGKPLSVRMTNCGTLGWVTDRQAGYRYQANHPETGTPWPTIPAALLRIWSDVSGYAHPPEACLVNFYEPSAKMGLHQDRDEQNFDAPVVSISLGDSCLFRVGQARRDLPTVSFRLESGDVVVLGGAARLAFHGVDRIYPSTSGLLKNGGRINLTLRRVTTPAEAETRS